MLAVVAARVMYRDGSAFERARSGLWELEKDVVDDRHNDGGWDGRKGTRLRVCLHWTLRVKNTTTAEQIQ